MGLLEYLPKWPFVFQKTFKNLKKIIIFALGPHLGPKMDPRWAQDGPKRAQDGPKRAEDDFLRNHLKNLSKIIIFALGPHLGPLRKLSRVLENSVELALEPIFSLLHRILAPRSFNMGEDGSNMAPIEIIKKPKQNHHFCSWTASWAS